VGTICNRGLELGKAVKFKNEKKGFDNIVASIDRICKSKSCDAVKSQISQAAYYPLLLFLQIPIDPA